MVQWPVYEKRAKMRRFELKRKQDGSAIWQAVVEAETVGPEARRAQNQRSLETKISSH